MTASKDLLLIFTRNPEAGKCKTRLAVTIGNKAALEVYKFLLNHTVSITRNLKMDKTVYYSEDIWENDIWENDIFDKKIQLGDDLGMRMLDAFSTGFDSGYEHIIVIGSDMYDLSANDIKAAFKALKANDFVIGPAKDGGYYLLGMNRLNTSVFQNKEWGNSTVFEATIRDLELSKLALLETRNDVDVYEDIEDNIAFQPFIKQKDSD